MNKGEPVRIRAADGKIHEAVYDEPYDGKSHFVLVGDNLCVTSSKAEFSRHPDVLDRVRFVYPIEQMENYKNKFAV